MKKYLLGLWLLLLTGLSMAAPVKVLASFSILGNVATEIGGNRVNVTDLVGADKDAHGYQLTPNDLKKIRDSQLVLLNGMGFEPADVTRAIAQSKIKAVVVTNGIKGLEMDHDHDHHGHHHHNHDKDPHVWNDPVLMQIYAKNIANALIAADPTGKAYYEGRLKAYQKQLSDLNTWAATQFNSIPKAQRKVLTSHDAFAYMAHRYGIKFIAPQGASGDSEASAKTVASIIKQVREQNVKAIFLENIKDPRLMQRISKETGVGVKGKLYSDALSAGNGPANSYIKMYRYNVGQMVSAMK